MAVFPRDVKDQVVEYPNRFKIDGVSHTIEPDFGIVSESGTLINKAYLQPIEDELGAVGTIKITARNDLGDEWLLCNGAEIDKTLYPVLYTESQIRFDGAAPIISDAYDSKFVIKKLNGNFIAGGSGGSTSTGRIFTTTKIQDGWTATQLISSGANIEGIDFDGTYYVAVGSSRWQTTDGLWYATDPDGTWTKHSQSFGAVSRVYYDNNSGLWVAVGRYSSSTPIIYYASDPTGTWDTITTIGTNSLNDIMRDPISGLWVIPYYGGVAYTDNFYGAWTTNVILAARNFYRIYYYNGLWLTFIYNDTSTRALYYTNDITGTWTSFTPIADATIRDLTYAHGYWWLATSTGLYCCTELTGTYSKVGTASSATAVYADDDIVVAVSDGITIYKVRNLPDITFTGAYAYIKAK